MRRGCQAKGDATSPVAAAATIAAAFLAGLGSVGLALAAGAVIVFILALEGRPPRVRRPARSRRTFNALARYGIIALAVLPVPARPPMGPYGAWNPSKLWWVVVLVTGFSFLGYVANRIFGARHGTIATALIGGAYSSTAVTQSLAQRLGAGEGGGAEPAGIALASAVMYLRVIVLVAILANRILLPFVILLAPAAGRRLARRLVALSQGRAQRRAGAAGQPDRAGPGARLPRLRRGRRGDRALGAGRSSASRGSRCCCS